MNSVVERILFGQFIVNKGLATFKDIHDAIRLQDAGLSDLLIGEILYKHFNVFESEDHVEIIYKEFDETREEILDEYKERNERRQTESVVRLSNSYLEKYIETSKLKFLERAILILEGEKEHKLKQDGTHG
jgi:hypothetical protein